MCTRYRPPVVRFVHTGQQLVRRKPFRKEITQAENPYFTIWIPKHDSHVSTKFIQDLPAGTTWGCRCPLNRDDCTRLDILVPFAYGLEYRDPLRTACE